uniref:Protein arginine N-methyltransferase 2 n=1 Tax=Cyclopterus lumpus TaxID=8103 RepID=A0A8C3AY99_CYCLU
MLLAANVASYTTFSTYAVVLPKTCKYTLKCVLLHGIQHGVYIVSVCLYAVETSSMTEYTRQLVKQNGCEEVFTVLQGRAEEIELHEQADVLVSEWMGNCLLFMVESVLLARDCWLKEGSVMWPSSAALSLVPCPANSYYAEKKAFWEQPCGLDLTPLQ